MDESTLMTDEVRRKDIEAPNIPCYIGEGRFNYTENNHE
jgi:hypothetical protein